MEELFGIKNFNLIQDEENYYFFRALNMADNRDVKEGTTLDEDGRIKKIESRTFGVMKIKKLYLLESVL